MTDLSKPNRGGAERVSRRARQAANKVQADKEALLVPPPGSGKAAAAKAAEQTTLARFPDTKRSTRKVAQQRNATQADVEAGQLAAAPEVAVPDVTPGTQPTLQQLRQLRKLHQGPSRDEAKEVGLAAGRFVRDTLLGRVSRATPHTRHRKLATQQDALQRTGSTV